MDCLRDQRGAASVEYAIVLGLVAVFASLAILALGPMLLELFLFQQNLLLFPVP